MLLKVWLIQVVQTYLATMLKKWELHEDLVPLWSWPWTTLSHLLEWNLETGPGLASTSPQSTSRKKQELPGTFVWGGNLILWQAMKSTRHGKDGMLEGSARADNKAMPSSGSNRTSLGRSLYTLAVFQKWIQEVMQATSTRRATATYNNCLRFCHFLTCCWGHWSCVIHSGQVGGMTEWCTISAIVQTTYLGTKFQLKQVKYAMMILTCTHRPKGEILSISPTS